MASTYSNLKIELIGTGEQSGTWGTTTNTNLGTAIEEAITGSVDISFSSADITLTLTDTNTTQSARNLRLNLTGTSGGARNLIVPAIEKVYIINNGLADACTVKNSSGTGIVVPAGKTMYLYNDSTNVVDAITHLSSLTLASPLPLGSGGTGATSNSAARTNLGLGTMATQNATAISVSGGTVGGTTVISTSGNVTASGTTVLSGTTSASGTLNVTGNLQLDGASGTSGQVLVSQGSGVTPIWGSGFPSGGIIMWSGSIASIPSGWYLCDGNNGTPNLKDRMVIGAGNLYAVNATGGSKDAIVVSHTHTGSAAAVGDHQHEVFGFWHWVDESIEIMATRLKSTDQSASGRDDDQTSGLAGGHSHSLTINSTGSSGTNANLPPYYALAFIMKS
jgi:hypothetical protein